MSHLEKLKGSRKGQVPKASNANQKNETIAENFDNSVVGDDANEKGNIC